MRSVIQNGVVREAREDESKGVDTGKHTVNLKNSKQIYASGEKSAQYDRKVVMGKAVCL